MTAVNLSYRNSVPLGLISLILIDLFSNEFRHKYSIELLIRIIDTKVSGWVFLRILLTVTTYDFKYSSEDFEQSIIMIILSAILFLTVIFKLEKIFFSG
jgi:hypothetical protein